MKKLFALCMAAMMLFAGCAQTAAESTKDDWICPLSDELDTRFQQIFYNKLENPTVEPIDIASDDSHGSGGGYYPEYSQILHHYKSHGISKGAFYFLEPPKSSLVYGLEHLAARGIFDFTYEPVEGITEENKYHNHESTFLTFSMEVELNDCELRNLILTYDESNVLNQEELKVPLTLENSKVFVDLSQKARITDNISDPRFELHGTLVHADGEFDFNLQI